jgi:hypothetical protein
LKRDNDLFQTGRLWVADLFVSDIANTVVQRNLWSLCQYNSQWLSANDIELEPKHHWLKLEARPTQELWQCLRYFGYPEWYRKSNQRWVQYDIPLACSYKQPWWSLGKRLHASCVWTWRWPQ